MFKYEILYSYLVPFWTKMRFLIIKNKKVGFLEKPCTTIFSSLALNNRERIPETRTKAKLNEKHFWVHLNRNKL